MEQGSYICTLSDDLYASYFTVHLRKRQSEHGRLKAPSTSSITYWQIEKDAVPLSGKLSPHSVCVREGFLDTILSQYGHFLLKSVRIYHCFCSVNIVFCYIGQTVNWGERCRIKHLPTRLYLAVIKNESDDFQV